MENKMIPACSSNVPSKAQIQSISKYFEAEKNGRTGSLRRNFAK